MKKTALQIVVAGALATTFQAHAQHDLSPEEAAVAANDRAYEAAYARGDVLALADFFAEDAEYTSDNGQTYRGRSEIEDAIRVGLRTNANSILTIHLEAVRLLAPSVLVEKGTTSVTATSGEVSGAGYTAIHLKRGDQWKISQLVETALPEISPHERLSELDWLIGKWEEADPATKVSVTSQYSWARGGQFLTRNIQVLRDDGQPELEGWQIIGWDPTVAQIHSWTFDNEGGFAEGAWTREGNRWLIRETGTTPDGGRTGADNVLTKLSSDQLAWESNNRTLDGNPRPSIDRIAANRVKGQ